LLLERQLVCDALDLDPFDLMRFSFEKGECDGDADADVNAENPGESGNGRADEERDEGEGEDEISEKKKNAEVIARVKGMLRVISCTRTVSPDGFSSIHCVVQLDNDGKMKDVKENIRLHFSFLREPQHENAAEAGGDDEVIHADANDEEGSSDECENKSNIDNSKNKGIHGQPIKKRKCIAKEDGPVDDKDETDDEISGSGSDRQNNQNNNSLAPKTIITYKIDYSVDYGKMEQLLGVDVYALGKHPSVEEAIAIDEGQDSEDDNSMNGSGDDDEAKECDDRSDTHSNGKENNTKPSPTGDAEFEEIEMSDHSSSGGNDDTENDADNGDRFGVFADPENVVAFLTRANLNLNEQSVFYFLLTFPFYEHEWDICGFLLSGLFDDDDEMEEEDSAMVECGEACPGDMPCCLPCN